MKIHIRFLILSIIYFTSCSDKVHLSIDNPTELSVEITVDTIGVLVPPKSAFLLEITRGVHQLTLENDSIINFNFIESAYMINPTFSTYLISDEYYGPVEFFENFKSAIPNKEITFLGMSLRGNYDIITDVITKETWDYGPRETLPNYVNINEKESYTSFIKIYDTSEYLDVIKTRI